MKQVKYTLMICILSMLNLLEVGAQGLSLSFNLTENDTLANIIADSKKYEITSLALSGVLNAQNTLYIQDLNLHGNLSNLDLSNVNSISPGRQIREIVINGYNKYEVGSISNILQYYGCPKGSADSLARDYPGHSTYGSVKISIRDQIYQTETVRSYLLIYEPAAYYWGTTTHSKTCVFPVSVLYPLRIFDINSFKKFVPPSNLICVGGYDCTYRVKSCEEYVLGNQIKTIGENAFKNSHIITLVHNETIDSIKAFAFENATGNILTDQQLLEQAKYIGEGAFRNSRLLDNIDGNITLQANRIGKYAFFNATIPNAITLQNIEEMGDSAFMNTNIRDVEIGDELKSISTCTFANCSELQSIEGGKNISNIGSEAFRGCIKLNSFNPASVLTTIGQEAFANDSSLTSFSIPDATIEIGYGAFSGSGLKSFQLGNFCDFRRDLIAGCDRLEMISTSTNNELLSSNDGVLFSKDGKRIIAYPFAKKDFLYEIENGVTEVEDSAFYRVKTIALSIPESVEKIGKNAFANSGIFDVKLLPSIPPKVTNNQSGLNQSLANLYVQEKDYSTYYIANYWGDFKNIFALGNSPLIDHEIHVEQAGTLNAILGFYNLNKYDTLRISGNLNGDDIRYLRMLAGRDIYGNPTSGTLTDLDISGASIVNGGGSYYIKNSKELTTTNNIIGENMFEGCNLTNIAINTNTLEIGDKALYGCKLSTFIVPAKTNKLNPNSFFGMNTLKDIVVENGNSNYSSVDGVLYDASATLLLYPYAKEGETYVIPKVKFYKTNGIWTDKTITKIGEKAFGGTYLRNVIISKGIKEICNTAFDNLSSLESLDLPSTLQTIGNRAFGRCSNLNKILCRAYNPPTLDYDESENFDQPYNNFSDTTYENAVLVVPSNNGGYKTVAGWKLFNNIVESDNWLNGIDDSCIDSIMQELDASARIYNAQGKRIPTLQHGLNIIKMGDGTIRKVMMK